VSSEDDLEWAVGAASYAVTPTAETATDRRRAALGLAATIVTTMKLVVSRDRCYTTCPPIRSARERPADGWRRTILTKEAEHGTSAITN
jgi:hypothetical protein